jgi:hypothetical protein
MFYLPLTPLRSGKYSINNNRKITSPSYEKYLAKGPAFGLDTHSACTETSYAIKACPSSSAVTKLFAQLPPISLAYCLENLPVMFL